ncbi:hypothetical protein VHEMI07126 [[Torrubiella] hemipterigena]|uniref:Uncharacterized protein n=1 Tax=[Torrubiella] hemipterigena TaxID=1531966 RepID=A0A0A1TKR7_9HYPO|nr:hypothetical protein VHEMI07126 [[Torrubiella] hemipterigena]
MHGTSKLRQRFSQLVEQLQADIYMAQDRADSLRQQLQDHEDDADLALRDAGAWEARRDELQGDLAWWEARVCVLKDELAVACDELRGLQEVDDGF